MDTGMQHSESMGDKWFPLGVGPQDISGVIATTLELGGSRPAWTMKDENIERMLMAWPKESLLRSAVVVAGKPEGKLPAVCLFPFMEGFANDLAFIEAYSWKDGHAGEILAKPEGLPPLWFYDPLFFRDITELKKDEKRTFYLSGLCFGIRRALLDELTVTEGPLYERHAIKWMQEHPEKTRLDVPPLKIPLKGRTIVDLGERCSEYQARAAIFEVDSFLFGPEKAQQKIYRFGVALGDTENPVYVIIYAPQRICVKGYEPKEGDDVDMFFWLQGRIADAEDLSEEPDADKEEAAGEVQ